MCTNFELLASSLGLIASFDPLFYVSGMPRRLLSVDGSCGHSVPVNPAHNNAGSHHYSSGKGHAIISRSQRSNLATIASTKHRRVQAEVIA